MKKVMSAEQEKLSNCEKAKTTCMVLFFKKYFFTTNLSCDIYKPMVLYLKNGLPRKFDVLLQSLILYDFLP